MRSSSNRNDDREAGMEAELIQKIEKVDFKQQMKMFYTAYSKVRGNSFDIYAYSRLRTRVNQACFNYSIWYLAMIACRSSFIPLMWLTCF